MQTIEQYLPEHPFFAGLEPAVLAQVAGCGRNVHARPGALLLRTGEHADEFFVVRRGRVAIELSPPAGGPVVLDSVHEGEVVGWSWLIPPHRYKFDARATEETSVISFDAVCLRGTCERDPVIGYALLMRVAQVMDRRLQSARVRLLDMYGSHA